MSGLYWSSQWLNRSRVGPLGSAQNTVSAWMDSRQLQGPVVSETTFFSGRLFRNEEEPDE
jgi:hypothetical protein